MSAIVGPRISPFINTYSLDFDGVDDYVDCGDVWDLASEPYTWSPFTLSFWYKGSNPIIGSVHTKSLFEFMTNQFIGVYDGFTGAANVRMYLNFQNTGNSWVVGSNGTVDLFDNQWHNVVIVLPAGSNDGVDTGNSKMYIDNTLITKAASAVITPPTAFYSWKRFKIMEGAWDPLQGTMDEVALWKTDKTSHIESLYNSGVPNDLTDLSPVAWYRMGDNGSYKSPQWLIPSNENKDKVSNYSFEFDGVDDYISVSDNSIGQTQNISYSIWVNLDVNTRQYIIGNQSSSNGGCGLQIESGDVLVFQMADGGNDSYFNSRVSSFSTYAPINTWSHILATWNGTDAKIYINGVLRNTWSPTLPYTISGYDTTFNIGWRSAGFSFMTNGRLDELALFNSGISISDVWNGSGQPIDVSAVSAITNYWKIGDNSTFLTNWTIPDEVGTSTGTSVNMTIEDRVGEAPNSTNNALSINMDEVDRVEDTP